MAMYGHVCAAEYLPVSYKDNFKDNNYFILIQDVGCNTLQDNLRPK